MTHTNPRWMMVDLFAAFSLLSSPACGPAPAPAPVSPVAAPAALPSRSMRPVPVSPLPGRRASRATAPAAGVPVVEPGVRYPEDQVLSPINAEVVAAWRRIAARDPHRDERVFIKIGDSHTASRFFFHCLAAETFDPGPVADREPLRDAVHHFARRLASGPTPFERVSLAARGGHSAHWAASHGARVVSQEIAALNPRFALLAFGTNDMGRFRDPAVGVRDFERQLTTLVDHLTGRGVVPILVGLPPRRDGEWLRRGVARFNDATRRLAEARRLPFVNLVAALDALPRAGLAPDGIHGSIFAGRRTDPCDFSPAGLAHGTNARNLWVLRALDQVRRALADRSGPAIEATRSPRPVHRAPG